MKKYFVKETDEELEFGDVVTLTFQKDTKNGMVMEQKEIEFSEGMVDFLEEMGIIEEEDTEMDEDQYEELSELYEELEGRVEKLESKMDKIANSLLVKVEELGKLLEIKKKKTAEK